MDKTTRLRFLDGLRGLCALYVLIFHEGLESELLSGPLAAPLEAIHTLFLLGHLPVVFFIVLSGYSLMMPVAKRDGYPLNGTFKQYVYRRARRIMPPYYAALTFSIATVIAYNMVAARRVEGALDVDVLVSHLLLVHNLSFDWAYRINAPMWSIPTEWQIYFVFALALLPLARRYGFVVTIATGFLVGSLPNVLRLGGGDWFWACPWFLGSFALGMTGAALRFSPAYADSWLRTRAPWGLFSLFGLIATIAVNRVALSPTVTDAVGSAFAFSLVNACAMARPEGRLAHGLASVLASRALVTLGSFSYSLYLLQHPFIKIMHVALTALHLGRNAYYVAALLGFTPVMCAIAWGFARIFEIPFTSESVAARARRAAESVALPAG